MPTFSSEKIYKLIGIKVESHQIIPRMKLAYETDKSISIYLNFVDLCAHVPAEMLDVGLPARVEKCTRIQ